MIDKNRFSLDDAKTLLASTALGNPPYPRDLEGARYFQGVSPFDSIERLVSEVSHGC